MFPFFWIEKNLNSNFYTNKISPDNEKARAYFQARMPRNTLGPSETVLVSVKIGVATELCCVVANETFVAVATIGLLAFASLPIAITVLSDHGLCRSRLLFYGC